MDQKVTMLSLKKQMFVVHRWIIHVTTWPAFMYNNWFDYISSPSLFPQVLFRGALTDQINDCKMPYKAFDVVVNVFIVT